MKLCSKTKTSDSGDNMVIAERSHFDRKKKKNVTNIVNFN